MAVPQPDHGGLLHAGFLLARGAFWAPGPPPGCSGGVSQICQGSGSAPRLRPFRTTPTVLGKHGSSTVELVLDSPQQSEDLPPIDWSFAFLLPSPSEFYLECILVYHVRLLQRPSAKSCLIGEASRTQWTDPDREAAGRKRLFPTPKPPKPSKAIALSWVFARPCCGIRTYRSLRHSTVPSRSLRSSM